MIYVLATTRGIANKGFSGLRNSVVRFNFCNGGYERSPHPLLAIPRERWLQLLLRSESDILN